MHEKGAIALMIWSMLFAGTATAQVSDHLECYKIKDSAEKATYVADLEGLAVEPGCEITVPAKLLCVDTTKSNVQPSPPVDGEGPPASRVACYKVKCPKREASSVQWTDQFGARPVSVNGSKYVCAPDLAPETSSARSIFVTSAVYDGNLGGLSGADSRCQSLALAAGLSGSYVALLSGTGVNAFDRIGDFEFRRTDGVVAANSKADLLDGPDAAIVLDQNGSNVSSSSTLGVWTATLSDGTYYGQNCNNVSSPADWSTTSSRTIAGLATATDSNWLVGAATQPCAALLRLYCVQQ